MWSVHYYFWLLEEFQIFVFAQEIKIRGKILAKKLDNHLIQLNAMVSMNYFYPLCGGNNYDH